jgi:hypothetical protein
MYFIFAPNRNDQYQKPQVTKLLPGKETARLTDSAGRNAVVKNRRCILVNIFV